MTHPLIGRELGNYRVVSLLGEGGMGAVFAGEHRFLGTRVAIKLLHGSYAHNPAVAQRFFQEAKSTIEIQHPNVIKILDFGQTDGGELYLVMELLTGSSLSGTLAKQGALGEGSAARIGASIAQAIAAAHAKGIVHRDLKPDNVFLTDADEVKVLDFGIAKVASGSSGTKTGSLLGTPQYMAPEQARGSKHVGPHSDVYALGAMLFEMVTGSPPFSGDDVAELLTKHLFEEPPRPSERAACSPEMEAIILGCLKKNPEERPASMAELESRLRARAGVEAPSGARPIVPTVVAGAAPPSVPRVPVTTTLGGSAGQKSEHPIDPAAPRPRSRTGVVAAGALVAVGGVIAFVVLRPSRAPERPRVDPPIALSATSPPAESKPPADPKPPAATPATAKPSAPAKARVVLRSDPVGATLTLDGKKLGTTPALVEVTLPQEIELTMPGYKPLRDFVTHEGESSFKLEADKKPSHPHAPKTKTPASSPTAPAAPPPAKPHREGLD